MRYTIELSQLKLLFQKKAQVFFFQIQYSFPLDLIYSYYFFNFNLNEILRTIILYRRNSFCGTIVNKRKARVFLLPSSSSFSFFRSNKRISTFISRLSESNSRQPRMTTHTHTPEYRIIGNSQVVIESSLHLELNWKEGRSVCFLLRAHT